MAFFVSLLFYNPFASSKLHVFSTDPTLLLKVIFSFFDPQSSCQTLDGGCCSSPTQFFFYLS